MTLEIQNVLLWWTAVILTVTFVLLHFFVPILSNCDLIYEGNFTMWSRKQRNEEQVVNTDIKFQALTEDKAWVGQTLAAQGRVSEQHHNMIDQSVGKRTVQKDGQGSIPVVQRLAIHPFASFQDIDIN